MPQNRHWQNRTINLQSKNNPYSMLSYCGHKYELTNHMHTAANSYAPVRCLRMGAFCIVLHENFSPAMVADLVFYVFLRRKGENTTLSLWATKGGERNERRQ